MTDRTNAERQRRFIARLKAQAAKAGVTNAAATKRSVTNAPDHAALAKELARARARIAELEKALASAAQRHTVQRSSAQQQQWHKPSAAEKRIMQLEARVRELEALVLPLDDPQKDALAQHTRKLNQQFKAWCKQTEAMFKQRHVTMHNKDYALFLAGFHPDASAEMRDKARNRFEKLYKKLVITDQDKVKWP